MYETRFALDRSVAHFNEMFYSNRYFFLPVCFPLQAWYVPLENFLITLSKIERSKIFRISRLDLRVLIKISIESIYAD